MQKLGHGLFISNCSDLGIFILFADDTNISLRKELTLIVSSSPAKDFISRSTTLWNMITPKLKFHDYSYKISSAKSNIKRSLLLVQNAGDVEFWSEENFNAQKISFIRNDAGAGFQTSNHSNLGR